MFPIMVLANDLVELFKVKGHIGLCAVLDKHTVHHLQNVVIRQVLPDKLCYLLQLLKSNLPSLLFVI